MPGRGDLAGTGGTSTYIDVVLFLLNPRPKQSDAGLVATCDTAARIAIIAFETPEILTELQRMNVHGVLSKPIRIFGILAALTTAVSLASHEARLKQRIKSLDDTLKARRKIRGAVASLRPIARFPRMKPIVAFATRQ